MRSFLVVALLAFAACTDQTVDRTKAAPTTAPTDTPPGNPVEVVDAGASADAAPVDAGNDSDSPPSGLTCTTSFGSSLTQGYGRLDGYVRAVIPPGATDCPQDDNHVMVQVDAIGGTYAIAVNVQSTSGTDLDVRTYEKKWTTTPFYPGGPWSKGWHASPGRFDYALDLGAHSTAFTATSKTALSNLLVERIKVGSKVSVYATGYATGDGAHLVHRNYGSDGAIVVDLDGSPSYLLFSFATQTL